MIRLKVILFDKRMSQAQLSFAAKVNQSSLNKILNGKEPPYPNRAKRIADALNWEGDPMELFEEVDEDE